MILTANTRQVKKKCYPCGRRENTFSSSGEVWSQKDLKVCKLSKVIFLEVVKGEGKKQNNNNKQTCTITEPCSTH